MLIERSHDGRRVAFGDNRGPAEHAFTFVAHPCGQVARSRLPMLGFASTGQTKAFLGPFVCLLFGHRESRSIYRLFPQKLRISKFTQFYRRMEGARSMKCHDPSDHLPNRHATPVFPVPTIFRNGAIIPQQKELIVTQRPIRFPITPFTHWV